MIDRECIEQGSEPRLEKGNRATRPVIDALRQECLSLFPPPPRGERPHRDLPEPVAGTARTDRGITDTSSWSNEAIVEAIGELKSAALDYAGTSGSARKWWDTFEQENRHRPALVFRLVEELVARKATITECFLAYVYSNTDNVQANLHYLDYKRVKEAQEKKVD